MAGNEDNADVREFDKLWDFSNPDATETKFRQLLPQAHDSDLKLLIQTQIARTYSLRRRFDEAHALLDTIEQPLSSAGPLVSVRYFLERGRTFNSAGEPAKALPLFDRARTLAAAIGAINFAIDAVHMLAVASPAHADQVRWNEEGLELCRKHPEHSRWLRPLNNNLGETYRAMGEFEKSLKCFQNLVAWYRERNLPVDRYARVDEAKLLRLCGRVDESLQNISSLQRELAASGESDGFVEEELAESLDAAGRSNDAGPHFRRAWELLQGETWLRDSEPARWERLKSRGTVAR